MISLMTDTNVIVIAIIIPAQRKNTHIEYRDTNHGTGSLISQRDIVGSIYSCGVHSSWLFGLACPICKLILLTSDIWSIWNLLPATTVKIVKYTLLKACTVDMMDCFRCWHPDMCLWSPLFSNLRERLGGVGGALGKTARKQVQSYTNAQVCCHDKGRA